MFKYVRDNGGATSPALKTVTANTAVTYKAGDAIVITSGKAAKATGTTKPEYICVTEATGVDEVACIQVLPGQEYEVPFAADGSALVEGAKVTIHTDGAQITATTTNGIVTIVRKLGTGASGTKAVVRF